jgi:hypothetical protein
VSSPRLDPVLSRWKLLVHSMNRPPDPHPTDPKAANL